MYEEAFLYPIDVVHSCPGSKPKFISLVSIAILVIVYDTLMTATVMQWVTFKRIY